jgi:hypothetical protein
MVSMVQCIGADGSSITRLIENTMFYTHKVIISRSEYAQY